MVPLLMLEEEVFRSDEQDRRDRACSTRLERCRGRLGDGRSAWGEL
jgi:hypothetical protein